MTSKRRIVPSRIINSEEFVAERAIDLKARRAGHLGDVTKTEFSAGSHCRWWE